MYCGSTSLVKSLPTHKTIYCLKCRSWQCEECAPRRASQLRALAKGGNPTRFLTLTIRFNDGDDPDAKARDLARAWRLLRARICKKHKIKQVQFLAVWERTKRGAPHLHIFMRGRFLKQKWLSEQMDDLINSPVVDIRKINNAKKAANYVTAYITKDNAKFEGCKRYWRSQTWDQRPAFEKAPGEELATWKTETTTAGIVVARLMDRYGGGVIKEKHYWIWVPPGSAGPPDLACGLNR